MKPITLLQPQRIVLGSGCIRQFADDSIQSGRKRLFILTAPPILPLIQPTLDELAQAGIALNVFDGIRQEPTVSDFKEILALATAFQADSIAGIGGGSVMDVAKLVAALLGSEQKVEELFGTGLVKGRNCRLTCLPTTAGTGSEVSPNAILLDERDQLKKGIVSPYLLADVAYVDPQLTVTVPPRITAETGMDALTHCIEAYTNKFAHPAVDLYALEGIRLIAAHLLRAVRNGNDLEAREALLLGSLYGGLCLGPVNTAAVHALSYPIGGEFHLSHGLSNALLLPSVMRFNCSANWKKYAEVALACGVSPAGSEEATALEGVRWIAQLSRDCGIPTTLTEVGIPRDATGRMAKAAMEVQRLLKNNPREVTEADAKAIYETLY